MINHGGLLYIMHYTARCMFTKKRLQDWTVQENVNLSPRTPALLWWINYTASRVITAWQVVDYNEHDRQPDFWAVTLFPWKYMSSVLVCLLVQSKAKSLSGVTLLLHNSLWPPSHSRFNFDSINLLLQLTYIIVCKEKSGVNRLFSALWHSDWYIKKSVNANTPIN